MLPTQDTFGKSDPFVRISRMSEDGSTLAVYKTEVVMNNLNPTWKSIALSLQRLSNGDPHRPLVLECFDWDKDGSHELIGRAQTSVDDLMQRCVCTCRCAVTALSLCCHCAVAVLCCVQSGVVLLA